MSIGTVNREYKSGSVVGGCIRGDLGHFWSQGAYLSHPEDNRPLYVRQITPYC